VVAKNPEQQGPHPIPAVSEVQPSGPSRDDHVLPGSAEELLHELHVHQIELKMQNDELRRTQLAMEESRDRYAELYDFAPVGYLTLSSKGIISEINLTAAELFGVERSKLLERRFAQFVAPQDSDRWYLHFLSILQHDNRQSCELLLRHTAGFTFKTRVKCLRAVQGSETIVRISLIVTDEGKTAEAVLRTYEARYRTLFENMLDVYYRTDMDGRINTISPSCLPETGYTQEELLGRPVMDFYADPAQRESLLRELTEKGKVNDFDILLIHKDGSPRVASVTSHLLLDKHGQAIGIEGILRDITGRKQAEEKLRLSEERYRVLFEQTADYVLVLETNGESPPTIIDANQAAFEKHGYTADELIGKPITFLDTEVSQNRVAERLGLLRTGKLAHFESEHTCKDGSVFWAEVTARLVSTGGKSMIYTVERDVTERKEAEKAQDSLLRENRKLVRQLMQVQEEERRLLARDLHDELGQLLTGIDARAEYIARHAKDADLRTMATEILRDTRASFDASHATVIRLRPGSLDALGITDALAELTGQWSKQIGIDCSLNIDGAIDRLDDMQAITIYRLVQEGITNAHRHGKANRVDVTIKSVPAHAGVAGQVLIEVSDNGTGMHEQRATTGMGIIGMRERVCALGGSFNLGNISGEGVRIEAMLPLDEREGD